MRFFVVSVNGYMNKDIMVASTLYGGYALDMKKYAPKIWEYKFPGMIQGISISGGQIYVGGLFQGLYKGEIFYGAKLITREYSDIRHIEVGDAILVIDKDNVLYYGGKEIDNVNTATLTNKGVIYARGRSISGCIEKTEEGEILSMAGCRYGGFVVGLDNGKVRIYKEDIEREYSLPGMVTKVSADWKCENIVALVCDADEMYAYKISLRDGSIREIFRSKHGAIRDIALTPSGDAVAIAVSNYIYVLSDEVNSILLGHWEPITSIKFTEDGNFLVSGGCDKRLMVWDWRRGGYILGFNSIGTVHYIKLAKKYIACASGTINEGTLLKLWDRKGKPVSSRIIEKSIFSFAVSKNRVAIGTGTIVGLANHSVYVYDVPKLKLKYWKEYSCKNISALSINGDKLAVGVNSKQSYVSILDGNGKEISRIEVEHAISSLDFKDRHLIIGTFEGDVIYVDDIFNPRSRKQKNHSGIVLFVAKNREYIVSGGSDGYLVLQNMVSGNVDRFVYNRWPIDITWQGDNLIVLFSDYTLHSLSLRDGSMETKRYPSPEMLVSPETIDLAARQVLLKEGLLSGEATGLPSWIAEALKTKTAEIEKFNLDVHVDPLYLEELAKENIETTDPVQLAIKKRIGPLTAAKLLRSKGISARPVEQVIDELIKKFAKKL